MAGTVQTDWRKSSAWSAPSCATSSRIDIPAMTSVLTVDVTRDLRYAKVRVSVMGSQEEQEKAIRALTRSQGYVRHLVSDQLTVRYIPEIVFELDQSISHSIRVSQILSDLKKSENEKQPSDT